MAPALATPVVWRRARFYVSAIRSAQLGMRVAFVDKAPPGLTACRTAASVEACSTRERFGNAPPHAGPHPFAA